MCRPPENAPPPLISKQLVPIPREEPKRNNARAAGRKGKKTQETVKKTQKTKEKTREAKTEMQETEKEGPGDEEEGLVFFQ